MKTREAIGAGGAGADAGAGAEGFSVSVVVGGGRAAFLAADLARLRFAVGVVVGKLYFVVMRCFVLGSC